MVHSAPTCSAVATVKRSPLARHQPSSFSFSAGAASIGSVIGTAPVALLPAAFQLRAGHHAERALAADDLERIGELLGAEDEVLPVLLAGHVGAHLPAGEAQRPLAGAGEGDHGLALAGGDAEAEADGLRVLFLARKLLEQLLERTARQRFTHGLGSITTGCRRRNHRVW